MTRRNLFRYLGGSAAALFAPGELLGTDSASRDGTYTTNPGALGETLYPLYSAVRDKFSLEDGKDVLLIDGQEQMMYLASEEGGSLRVSRVYPVSTSRRGFGNRFGSGKTPLGIHMIKEKYGGDAPVGAVFRDRSLCKIYEGEIGCERLYGDIFEPVLRICMQMLPSPSGIEEAKEAANDAVFAIWNFINNGKYVETGKFPSLVTKIARRRAIDADRNMHGRNRNGRKREVEWVGLDDLHESQLHSRYDPYETCLCSEIEDAVDSAARRLPGRSGYAFREAVLNERKYDEVAREMNIEPGTVYALVNQARNVLKRRLLHAPITRKAATNRNGNILRLPLADEQAEVHKTPKYGAELD